MDGKRTEIELKAANAFIASHYGRLHKRIATFPDKERTEVAFVLCLDCGCEVAYCDLTGKFRQIKLGSTLCHAAAVGTAREAARKTQEIFATAIEAMRAVCDAGLIEKFEDEAGTLFAEMDDVCK